MSASPPSAAPPAAPMNLRATAGDRRVALHWSPPGGAANDIVYRIYRARPAGGADELPRPNWTHLSVTDIGEAGAGLTNGASHCYYVRAKNAAGQSPPSDTVCATPEDYSLARIQGMAWRDYYDLIEAETDPRRRRDPRVFEQRREVIRVVQGLFNSVEHFNELGTSERKMIAGLVIDFGWFGDMGAAGAFMGFIYNNNQRYTPELNAISQALDLIPATGGVSRGAYVAYVGSLPKGCAIGAGTRLLAMKRPDTFVCVCGGNRQRLCPAFNTAPASDWRGIGIRSSWRSRGRRGGCPRNPTMAPSGRPGRRGRRTSTACSTTILEGVVSEEGHGPPWG